MTATLGEPRAGRPRFWKRFSRRSSIRWVAASLSRAGGRKDGWKSWRWSGYVLAIALTALAALLRRVLDPLFADTGQFLLFYFSVMLAAVAGGMRAGLLATALAAVVGLGEFVHLDHVGRTWNDDLTRLAFFLLFSAMAAVLAGRLRDARDRAAAHAKDLAKAIENLQSVAQFPEENPQPVLQIGPEGQVLYANHAAEVLLAGEGWDRGSPAPRRLREAVEAPGGGMQREFDWRCRDERVLSFFCVPFVGKGYANLYGRDVTEARRAEETLRESERRYRIVADHTDAWEFWLSPEGRFLYNSPSCKRVTGYDAEAFQADPELFDRIIYPADRNLYEEHRGHGHEACVTDEAEFRIVRADGTVRWIDHTCVPLYDEARRFLGIRGSNRDITERKRSEEALRESEERYRTLFEAIDEGFCIIEVIFDESEKPLDYRFLQINPAFERQTGLRAAKGKKMREFAPKHEEYWFEIYGRIALTRQPARFQQYAEYLHRWFDVYAFPVGQPEDRQVAILFNDITDGKQAEEDLRAAKDSAEDAKAAAEQANRAKDHFLAVLSHELRTPLTPVVMALSLLQERADFDPKVSEMLEMVRRNVELETRLIDDLLDVSRIVRGKLELHRRAVELGTVIQRAVEVCQPDIDARRLHFGVDLGTAAPYWVEADVPRLQQVFWNLLKNAIKFTPHGGCVGIRCRPNEKYVIAEVNDSGIGIEPEALSRVFNAFEQAERSITQQFGGLGLGLAISKALVEMHGGQIEAHSEGPGKGATFRVRLPLATPAGQLEVPPPVAPQERIVRSLRILLVEDHGITAKMMQMILNAEGHTVKTAGDIATALELTGQHAFDLLLSDLGLPDGSGHDLIRQLRGRGHNFPGIALSGYGQEEDIQRSREAGFTTHLTKPASREAVVGAVLSVTAGEPTTLTGDCRSTRCGEAASSNK